ncbi:helix-turn-helix domain-containing protein [Micromonospora sp. DT233]|uniref:helix-turn-helix domain-containing protein n=1 Tax=Micromonospora sp. DT233 TaxID=3393432 RepID=UPI003CF7AAA1
MSSPDWKPTDRPTRPADEPQVWTAERIRALGPATDLTTAAAIFGLSRSAAYDLAKRGDFPVDVLRFGSRYRVPVAAILHALHLPAGDDNAPPDTPPQAT